MATQVEFYAYVDRVLDKCKEIMHVADKEYASEGDKYANFKWQAEAEGRTPEQVGITFMLKHVRSLARGVSVRESMEGRMCDIINYVLLIGGMREEAAQAAIIDTQDLLRARGDGFPLDKFAVPPGVIFVEDPTLFKVVWASAGDVAGSDTSAAVKSEGC